MSGNAQGQQGHMAQLLSQRPYSTLIRPDQVQKLPQLDQPTKAKYAEGIQRLWDTLSNRPRESKEHAEALKKLMDVSSKLGAGFKQWQNQQGSARPQAQGQPAQPAHQQQAPPAQPAQQPNVQPEMQQQQQPLPPQVAQHIQSFPFTLPPNMVPGTAEGNKKLAELRATYAQFLMKQENAKSQTLKINALMEQRKSQGLDVPADLINRKAATEQDYNKNKTFIDEFRNTQRQYMAQRQQQQQQQQQQQPQREPQVKVEGNTSVNNATSQQPFQLRLPGSQSQQQPGQSPAPDATAANSALEAARNTANVNQSVASPATSFQPPLQGQIPTTHAQSSQASAAPSLQLPQQPPSFNAPRPQLSTQQQAQNAQPLNHSPHAPSINPGGHPVPLSHQAAVSAAARTYSDQRGTPQLSLGQGHQLGKGEQMNNPKMPIPKQLSVSTPQPVSIGPARPTLGGPGNGAPGMMGQPVIARHPGYVLEGDGDRVLSKKKLDELVRQVTGGGEGLGGQGLTPEVEEAVLQLADDFVDTVISSACRLAKLRDSSTLDIRDLQLVLERNYNIRVPGYASDEVRTVRKFHPAPGWTQKMNAIQAAKVMGGKTDI